MDCVNHLFVQFYHKISGESMQMWLGQIENFKQIILYRLAQHPIERERFDADGHPERAQYSMFSTEPPSLQDYLPLDEPIHHYVPNDAIVYNYYVLD
jgi:hypothetical protein